MLRVQDGDTLAFAELYDRHVDLAMDIAADICRDSGRTEDAVQEAFFSIWRSRADYRPQLGTVQAWSMRIVHNRAVDSLRSVRARPSLSGPEAEPDSLAEADENPPLTRAIAASERTELFVALHRLPVPQARVLILSFFGNLSQSEIAVSLGVPTGTVKGRTRSGLEKLRYQLLFADRSSVGK